MNHDRLHEIILYVTVHGLSINEISASGQYSAVQITLESKFSEKTFLSTPYKETGSLLDIS